MMKNKRFIILILCAVALGIVSCEKDFLKDGDPSYNRAFRPTNLAISAINGTPATKVEFKSILGINNYQLQVGTDSLDFSESKMAVNQEISISDPGANVTVTLNDLAGDTKYFFRIRSVKAASGTGESEWSLAGFKTPAENIFKDFMDSNGTISKGVLALKWIPKANVTSVELTPKGGTSVKVNISDAEKENGVKTVTDLLNNTVYTVKIFRNSDLRGTYDIKVEGDVFLENGGDLQAALGSAVSGDVIVLESGGNFTASDSYTLRNGVDVVVKGGIGTALPFVNFGAGKEMFKVSSGANIGSIRLEKLKISDMSYLANINTTGRIGKFYIENCQISNLATAPLRLRSSFAIDSVIYNNTIFSNVGSSGYALVMVDGSTVAKDIRVSNCTVYNYPGCFIRYNSSVASYSLNISNCTINNCFDGSKYFLRVDNTGKVGTINIEKTIIGQAKGPISGITANVTANVSTSYRTSDFDDSGNIINGFTVYSGTAALLFKDPANGDFHFKDSNFAGKSTAGDPRWRE